MIPHNPALILQGGVVYPVAADSEGRIDGPGKEQTRVFTDDVWDYDRFGDDPEDGLGILLLAWHGRDTFRIASNATRALARRAFILPRGGCARRGEYEIGVGCG